MALSAEEKQKLLVLLTLLSGGASGRQTLSTIQPILQLIEQRQADDKARKDKRRGERNAIASQVGGLAGSLGGMYLIGQALAPATAGTAGAMGAGAVGAGTAGTSVATPTLVGAQTVNLGGTGAASGGSTLGSVGSVALPVAVAALTANNAWEGGLKDIVRGKADRSDWTNQAINMNPYTAPINMALRMFGKRSIGRMTTTGKSDAQMNRDDFRGALKEKGIVDKDYNVTLANGQKFNLGLDGKTKYTNSDGKTTRNAWDVDLNDPLAQYAVSKIDPYIRQMYGNAKGINPEQYTGMVVNAVTSGAKTKEEIDANINSVLGSKPFEGTPPVRTSSAPPPPVAQTNVAPAPPPTPTPPPVMRTNSVQDVLRPPAANVTPPQQQQQQQPAPQPAPQPQQQQQPAYRPPAPLPPEQQGRFLGPAPLPSTQSSFLPPAPQNQQQQQQNGPQGLLSLQDKLKQQGGGNMDLNGILNMLKNLQQQNGARR